MRCYMRCGYVVLVFALSFVMEVFSMRIAANPELVELRKRTRGVSDRFVEALKHDEVFIKLKNLEKLYGEIQMETFRSENEFSDLLECENTSDVVLRKGQIEERLKSLELENCRVYREMQSLYIGYMLSSDDNLRRFAVVNKISSLVNGDIDLVDQVRLIK